METISNEIKAKVFAQYLCQKIIHTDGTVEELKSVDTGICYANFGWGNAKEIGKDCKLLLKPLSAISDTQCFDISRLLYPTPNRITRIVRLANGFEIYNQHEMVEYVSYSRMPAIMYEWCIDNGFDTPKRLLNGKTLKECDLCTYE